MVLGSLWLHKRASSLLALPLEHYTTSRILIGVLFHYFDQTRVNPIRYYSLIRLHLVWAEICNCQLISSCLFSIAIPLLAIISSFYRFHPDVQNTTHHRGCLECDRLHHWHHKSHGHHYRPISPALVTVALSEKKKKIDYSCNYRVLINETAESFVSSLHAIRNNSDTIKLRPASKWCVSFKAIGLVQL